MLTVSVADESQLEWVSIFVVFVEVGSSTRQLVVILECVNGETSGGYPSASQMWDAISFCHGSSADGQHP